VEDLGLSHLPSPVQSPPTAAMGDAETEVVHALRRGASSVDELVLATGLPGAAVLAALTTLELRGLVLEVLGRYQPAGVLADRPRRGLRSPARRPAEPAA